MALHIELIELIMLRVTTTLCVSVISEPHAVNRSQLAAYTNVLFGYVPYSSKFDDQMSSFK